jgi:hypothetical protein
MHLLLEKVKRAVLFYNLSLNDLESFSNAFFSHGVPEANRLFAVVDVKKVTICKPT